jgi:hypothetical protein
MFSGGAASRSHGRAPGHYGNVLSHQHHGEEDEQKDAHLDELFRPTRLQRAADTDPLVVGGQIGFRQLGSRTDHAEWQRPETTTDRSV